MIEIGDQPTCRRRLRTRQAAEPIERYHTEKLFQPCFPRSRIEIGARSGMAGNREPFGHDDLGRRKSCQFGIEAGARRFTHLEPAGRNIRGSDPHHIADRGKGDQPIGRTCLEQRFFGQCARSHDPDDPARYN